MKREISITWKDFIEELTKLRGKNPLLGLLEINESGDYVFHTCWDEGLEHLFKEKSRRKKA